MTSKYKVVFLICSERSGSNLIRVMLDAHSKVLAPPPLNICKVISNNFHIVSDKGRDSEAWPLMRDFIGSKIEQFYDEPLRDKVLSNLDDIEDLCVEAIIRAIYDTLIEEFDSPLLFIKENNVHQYLFFLLAAYPEAKFVFQVRDPRDYLASARALRRGRLGNKFGSTHRALSIWRADQLCGLSLLANFGPSRIFLQRYEDLISSPEEVLSELCGFLELQFESSMLEFHNEKQTRKISSMGNQWENLGRPVMSNNGGGYRKKLSKRLIKTVEVYLGQLLDRFNYQREFKKDLRPSFFQIFSPQLTSPLERLYNKRWSIQESLGSSGPAHQFEKAASQISLPYSSPTKETLQED